MKYKILSWENGEAEGGNPCIMTTVECTPNWFMRKFFNCLSYSIDCYGEEHPRSGWNWYYADEGTLIPKTTYVDYDAWGAGRRLGDFLENYRKGIDKCKNNKRIMERIKKARKI